MYTDVQFEELEHEERILTEEAIILLLLALGVAQSEVKKEVYSFYQKYGKDGVVTYNDVRKWVSANNRQRRLTVLFGAISVSFGKLFTKLKPKMLSILVEIAQKETDFFDSKIDIDKVVSTKWGVDDTTWDIRLKDDVDLWNIYVATDLKRAFMRRDNIDDVIKQINKRFTTMEHIIQKLAMTESTAVGSLARREIFEALGIKKYRFYAREDERTCEICGSLHGLVFPVSSYEIGVNASPIHPWCRCWEVPITNS